MLRGCPDNELRVPGNSQGKNLLERQLYCRTAVEASETCACRVAEAVNFRRDRRLTCLRITQAHASPLRAEWTRSQGGKEVCGAGNGFRCSPRPSPSHKAPILLELAPKCRGENCSISCTFCPMNRSGAFPLDVVSVLLHNPLAFPINITCWHERSSS